MNLAIGQRWIRINFSEKYGIEIISILEGPDKERCSVNGKVIVTDCHLKIGQVQQFCVLPKTGSANEYWAYMAGQDRP